MRAFADLYCDLDSASTEGARVDALARYLEHASDRDAAWAIHLLASRAPKRPLTARWLRSWVREAAGVPEWLFARCRQAVGDVAETHALLFAAADEPSARPLHDWIEQRLLPLADAGEEARRRMLSEATAELDERQLLVWMKLLGGGLRAGVSRRLLVRALVRVSGLDTSTLAHRLSVAWPPTAVGYRRLLAADTADADISRPYPFEDAEPVPGAPAALGAIEDWRAQWWWDGLRAQLVRRRSKTFLWSREERLLDGRFPELEDAAAFLPDGTVLDGEVVAWRDGRPLGAAALARRLARPRAGRMSRAASKIQQQAPVVFFADDLLEQDGEDLRLRRLDRRRRNLGHLLDALGAAGERLEPSAAIPAASWKEVAGRHGEARAIGAAGLVLRRRDAPYGGEAGGRRRWPAAPLTLAAVLMYAERGHGANAALYCQFTFGLRHGGEWVPFTKTGEGLDDAEVRRVDAFVRRHAVERFGPVRALAPELVFEIAFDGVEPAPRRKSGIAARSPHIARRREDLTPDDADTLDAARALLPARE